MYIKHVFSREFSISGIKYKENADSQNLTGIRNYILQGLSSAVHTQRNSQACGFIEDRCYCFYTFHLAG